MHSKGPWRIDNWDEIDSGGREYVDILDAQGVNICTVADCDARLIAAAPEMLDALRAVMSGDLRAAELVIAAIAKAEGRTP